MAKININFNGSEYAVDESKLSAATDSLKTHLLTEMKGEGGGLAPITYDGVVGDRVTVAYGDTLTFVKVSDKILSKNDLIDATLTGHNVDPLTLTGDHIIERGGCVCGPEIVFISVSDIDMMAESFPFTVPETGTYFGHNTERDVYISSLTFPAGSSAGSTTIILDGVEYSVDPTKLSTATDGFVAHIGTLTGEGGDKTITWDGVVGDRPVFDSDGDMGGVYAKVSDKVLTKNDFIGSTMTLSNGDTYTGDDTNVFDSRGCATFYLLVISVPEEAVEGGLVDASITEAGTYFAFADGSYVQSLNLPNSGSTSGDTKLTVNGTEYLVDSAKVSTATDSISNVLSSLSNVVTG